MIVIRDVCVNDLLRKTYVGVRGRHNSCLRQSRANGERNVDNCGGVGGWMTANAEKKKNIVLTQQKA